MEPQLLSPAEIIQKYEWARVYARYKGFHDESLDFAGWFICRQLRGIGRTQFMRLALFDYLRETRGDLREKNGVARVRARERTIPIEEYAAYKRVSYQPTELKHVVKMASLLHGRDLKILRYYIKDELTLKEIGKKFGVTESYICNRIKAITEKLKRSFNGMDLSAKDIELI